MDLALVSALLFAFSFESGFVVVGGIVVELRGEGNSSLMELGAVK